MNKISIDENVDKFATMLAKTGQRSAPQIFINDHYVGGFDNLVALERDGRLDNLLTDPSPKIT